MGKKKRHDEVELYFEPEVEDDLPELDPAPANALVVTVDFVSLLDAQDGNVKRAYEIVTDLRDLLR